MIDNVIKKVNSISNDVKSTIQKLKMEYENERNNELWRGIKEIEKEGEKIYSYPLPKTISKVLEEELYKVNNLCGHGIIHASEYHYELTQDKAIARSIAKHDKGMMWGNFYVCRESPYKWRVCMNPKYHLFHSVIGRDIEKNIKKGDIKASTLDKYKKIVIDDAITLKSILKFAEKYPNKIKDIVEC